MYVCMYVCTNDADAFRSLQGLAQGTKELAGMLPTPKATDGSPCDNRARMWAILRELRPDGLALEPMWCKGCWICGEITRLGGSGLLNEGGKAPALRDVTERLYSTKKIVKFGRAGRIRVSTGAHLKPRRAWARDKSRGRSPNNIIQRTPAIILDTRLNDTQNKGTYRCDVCEKVFHGPFQGEFTEEARDLSYDELSSGWKHGALDASWFCVDCWKDNLDIDTVTRTREELGLPRASRPAAVRDNRFHKHSDRWCVCDNCDCYCTGRARDWLPGSFVYARDSSLAGPP